MKRIINGQKSFEGQNRIKSENMMEVKMFNLSTISEEPRPIFIDLATDDLMYTPLTERFMTRQHMARQPLTERPLTELKQYTPQKLPKKKDLHGSCPDCKLRLYVKLELHQ